MYRLSYRNEEKLQRKQRLGVKKLNSLDLVLDGPTREMSTAKMNTTEFQNKVLSELALIREMLTNAPHSTDSSMKKPKRERKPRDPNAKPNDWIVFTGRVREILKANDFPAGKACQQFASFLKASHTNAYSMSDKDILAARSGWEAPPPKPKPEAADEAPADDSVPKPKPKRTLSDEQKAKMAAGRKAAAERRKAEAAAESAKDASPAEPAKTTPPPAPAPVPAPVPSVAEPTHPAATADKKLRPLPLKGKKYLWDTETNGLWMAGPNATRGDWVGIYNKTDKTIDRSAPNPEDE